MAHDVFISFSFKDSEKVDKIVNHLTNIYNIPCWICTEEIRAGENFRKDIAEAIKNSKLVVFVQSKLSASSEEVSKELLFALKKGKMVKPFVIEESQLADEVELELSTTHYIDATIPTLEERIRDLAKDICRSLNRPFTEIESKTENTENVLLSTTVEPAKDDIFIGRDALMDEIHTSFVRHNTIFLQGMGGIGKSELAKQYYYKYKSNESEGYYNKVIFARFDGDFAALIADDLIFNIKGVSRKTNKNNEQQSDEEYAREKIKILKNICDNRTLFIIDNFDVDADDEKLFAEFIDKAPYRVLVTTRNMQTDYKMISVKELDDESLKSIFIKYFGEEDGRVSRDDPAFDDLFEWTDRHTLTIELIAKYMKSSRRTSSIRSMLDILSDKHLAIFSEAQKRQSQKNPYDRIRDILRISYLCEDDIYFLRCLSLMPASGIRYLDFFEKWIHCESDNELFWDNVLDKLSELGIVKENKNSGLIYLHPIVREVVLNELKPSYENCKDFVNRCAMVGEDVIPLMYGLSYEEKAIYLGCYSSILEFITKITVDTYPLFVNISHLYDAVGGYSETISLHEQIYSFAKVQFGEKSTETMLVLNRIGWKNSNCMLYDRALPYYKTTADWFIENPCYSSREAQATIQNCGNLYYYLYKQTHDPVDLKNAHDYLDKNVAYGKKMIEATTQESEHFRLHLKYQNDCICRDYFKLHVEEKNFVLARKCLEKYKQVVEDFQNVSKSPNADMAGYYRHLATLEYELEHYLEAREALKEAHRLYLHYFSNNNPRMISILEELIMCCIKLNDYEQANKYLTLAIEGASTIFTEDHPTLLRLRELSKSMIKKV